jgi:uncharacterized protein
MLHIRDTVVGSIIPSDVQLALIEDSHMQRLRYVKQIGFGYLVYPGANHTRFEHSIGVMHVTGEILKHLGEQNDELESVGLLHDIGHAAFSHCSDGLLERHLKTTHEKVGEEIIQKSSIKDVVQNSTLSLKKLLELYNEQGYGELVTGSFGADRLDYLLRDAMYSGVAYGVVDYQNIKDNIKMYKNKPAIYRQGIVSIESLLIARYSMFTSVYRHHANLIAQGMYENAVDRAIESGEMDPVELKSLNDFEMTHRLMSIGASKELITRVVNRKLFKRAYFDYVSGAVNLREIKERIEKAGLRPDQYNAKTMKFRGDGGDIPVVDKDGGLIGSLQKLSPLVKTLTSTLDSRERLIVSCDSRDVEKVKKAIEKVVGVSTTTETE